MKPSLRKILLFVYILVLVKSVFPADTTKPARLAYLPDYYKMQFAGNIGIISLGAGYSVFEEKFQSTVFYSFIPGSFAGVNIHTIAFKNSLIICKARLYSKMKISPYIGGSAAFSGHLPVQLLPHIGGSIHKSFKVKPKGADFYVELGTTAAYLDIYMDNQSVDMISIINVAFGTSIYL